MTQTCVQNYIYALNLVNLSSFLKILEAIAVKISFFSLINNNEILN